MKGLCVLSAILGVGILIGRVAELSPGKVEAAGGGGGGTAVSGNGDVNGDGRIDIPDGIYILHFLFASGPEPKPCPAGGGGEGLPDTGQSACYGFLQTEGLWVEVPCAEASCPGQDEAHATGCPPEGRFIDNGDGTVTDKCTGLMWQQSTADVDGDGQVAPESDRLPWCQALRYCEDLSFAGHQDWRLPNARELHSIVDYGRFDPAIDPVFGAFSASAYWSSTSGAGGPDVAWNVGFYDGDVYVDAKDSGGHVRAVRSGS